MDPYSSPHIIRNNDPYNPLPRFPPKQQGVILASSSWSASKALVLLARLNMWASKNSAALEKPAAFQQGKKEGTAHANQQPEMNLP